MRATIRAHGTALVAFSGGVDSTFVLKIAVEELVLELRFDAENALGDEIERGARAALEELVSVVVARDR